MKISNCINKK